MSEVRALFLLLGTIAWTSRRSPRTPPSAITDHTEHFYCRTKLSFCFQTDGATSGPRCYESPAEGALEAGRSRIIQGIHFRFSDEEGRRLGQAIGREIATKRLRLLGSAATLGACVTR